MNADVMLDKGNLDGRQVVAAINELQPEKLKPGSGGIEGFDG